MAVRWGGEAHTPSVRLSLEMSMHLWAVTVTGASPYLPFPTPLGGTGWLEEVGVGCFPSLMWKVTTS